MCRQNLVFPLCDQRKVVLSWREKSVGWNSKSNLPLLLMHLQAATWKRKRRGYDDMLSWRLSGQQQLHHFLLSHTDQTVSSRDPIVITTIVRTINCKPRNVREFSMPSGDGLIMMDMQTVIMWQSLWICQTYHSSGNTRYNLKTCLTAQSWLFYESSWLPLQLTFSRYLIISSCSFPQYPLYHLANVYRYHEEGYYIFHHLRK